MATVPPVQKTAAGESRANGRRLHKVEQRVKSLEESAAAIKVDVAAVKTDVGAVKTDVATVKGDTAEILSVVTTTKKVGGFVRKYIKPAIVFGAGIFTAAGMLNPKVGAFIAHFFGG